MSLRGLDLLELVQHRAFSVAGAPVTFAEVLGDVAGLASVWLAARESVLSWPIGLVNNALFCAVFFVARLYATASLQIVFAALAVYGWWTWGARAQDTRVRRTTRREWAALAACGLAVLAAATVLLRAVTDSPAPFWDALVLALSLVATYGKARKLVESWWLWLAVDAISIPLCATQRLYPTALLFVGYAVLGVIGLRAWRAKCEG